MTQGSGSLEDVIVASDSDPLFPTFDAEMAFAAYEQIRHRLPSARFAGCVTEISSLADIEEAFDVFVFDAYGVLNVGPKAIPGAVARVSHLQEIGKSCFVITNAASYDQAAAQAKFRDLGFSFPPENIITSRMAAERSMARQATLEWTVLGLDADQAGQIRLPHRFCAPTQQNFDGAEAFLFLSNLNWSAQSQYALEASLRDNPRPVLIANPDLVAPQLSGMSTEPGYFGHRLADLGIAAVRFHGKPFASVFETVEAELARRGLSQARIVMMGDTLHTDVLGAQAAGWSSVLVADHGLFRGQDIRRPIALSGIVPDYLVPSI